MDGADARTPVYRQTSWDTWAVLPGYSPGSREPQRFSRFTAFALERARSREEAVTSWTPRTS